MKVKLTGTIDGDMEHIGKVLGDLYNDIARLKKVIDDGTPAQKEAVWQFDVGNIDAYAKGRETKARAGSS